MVFKLNCYDSNSKSYKSTVNFTGENPFSIQFVKTTPSYSIPLVQSSSPPSSPPPEVVTGESATTVVQSDFENKDNEIDYGFYISTERASGHKNEKEGNADKDYVNLISSTCGYDGPLKDDLFRYDDRNNGYQTPRGEMTLKKYARKVPTKNEKKLMEWNKQIYEQELKRATEQLDLRQKRADEEYERRENGQRD